MRGSEKLSSALLLGILISFVSANTLAAETGGVPIDQMYAVPPRAQVMRLELPVVDRLVTAAEDIRNQEDGRPARFASRWDVNLTTANSGSWETLATGERLWRLRVHCPAVLSLNLGFTRYDLPQGARLQIYAVNDPSPVLVFGPQDNRPHGQLWTPVLLSDEIMVELLLKDDTWDSERLRLTAIGRGYRFFGEETATKSGYCNIDVICPPGDPWREEIATVGVYSKGGSNICTGVMMNNTAQDEKSLFLTADHCEVSDVAAPSVVVYWNFERPVCGEQGGGRDDQFTVGSTRLAGLAASDFTLLELDSAPNPVFGVNYAGWDRSTADPSRAVGIHHPSGDEKSISFEIDPLTTTSYKADSSPGDGTHLRVADWDLGTTEPGSSGSPLFNQNKLVVGQLHGGFASCELELPDWYGRLSHSWEGGGTADTRLRDWLDPLGSAPMTLALLDPDGAGNGTEPGTRVITILGTMPRPFNNQVRVDFHLATGAAVQARVLDVRGQVVWDPGTRTYGAGDQQIIWDGFHANGTRAPSGHYILYLSCAGGEARTRLILIR